MAHLRDPSADLTPLQAKKAAELAVVHALAHFRYLQREPDAWEAMRLQCAIDAVSSGQYPLSAIHLRKALMRPRSGEISWPRDESTPTLDQLARHLAVVASLSVRHR